MNGDEVRYWTVFGVGFGAGWPALLALVHWIFRRQPYWYDVPDQFRVNVALWLSASMTINVCLAWLLWAG